MSERSRASLVGTIGGLLLIATIAAAGGLWLREHTNDRREVWLVNPGSTTAVVYLGDERRTLLAGEVLSAHAPAGSTFQLGISLEGALKTTTVTRSVDQQEVLLIDLVPEAAYVVLDMTPRYAAHGTVAARRRNLDGKSFRPEIVQAAKPGRVIRLRAGTAATIGPLEPLPVAVWLARKYGQTVHKILRVSSDADVGRLQRDVEQALADQKAITPLERPASSMPTGEPAPRP